MCFPLDEFVSNYIGDNESAAGDHHSYFASRAFRMWLRNAVWLNDQRIGRRSHAYGVRVLRVCKDSKRNHVCEDKVLERARVVWCAHRANGCSVELGVAVLSRAVGAQQS